MSGQPADLVRSALYGTAGLGPAYWSAALAFMVMCDRAYGSESAPVYVDGWEPIADALGMTGPPDTRRRKVNRLWRMLRDLGYVQRVTTLPLGCKAVVYDAVPYLLRPPNITTHTERKG